MTALVKTLGEALRKNCPDNDCRIFLNQYNKLIKSNRICADAC